MMGTDRLRDSVRPAYRWIASQLPPGARRRFLHDLGTRTIGNFRSPATFNEKVNWRILNDRRQMVADACDKVKMKETARAILPESRLRIPRTYWTGTDVLAIPDELLTQEWVAKPNHSSGQVLFGPKTREEVSEACQGWLHNRQADHLAEWGYSEARHLILLEEKLPSQGTPIDYKFFVFDGRPEIIQVNLGRFANHVEALYYSDWTLTGARDSRLEFGETPRPEGLDQMIDVAAELGRGWDFIRVDLYYLAGEIWFGELSPYPGGGVTRWRPRSFNRDLGKWWRLPARGEVTSSA